jgi:hypothetical protein
VSTQDNREFNHAAQSATDPSHTASRKVPSHVWVVTGIAHMPQEITYHAGPDSEKPGPVLTAEWCIAVLFWISSRIANDSFR